MTKGYWIGHVTVEDAAQYEAYRAANGAVFAEYGARFLVRGGTQEVVEGALRPRCVVIEFDSFEAARACYFSQGYQDAKALRINAGISDLAIVDGYAG